MAEALGWPVASLRRCLRLLETAGLALVDRETREVFVSSAVASDAARNEQAVKAFAADWSEVRSAALRSAIHEAVAASFDGLEKGEISLTAWLALTADSGDKHSNKHPNKRGTPQPAAIAIAIATSQQPPPQPAVAAAWARLPPPFAAAAAAELALVETQMGLETFGALVRALSCSKFRNPERFNLTGGTPTLRRLLAKPEFADRIIRGEFRDPALAPSCAQCQADHDFLEGCPPVCVDCERHHLESYFCDARRRREEAARELANWPRSQETQRAMEREQAAVVEGVSTGPEPLEAVTADPVAAVDPGPHPLRASLPANLRASLEAHASRGRAS
jgi:hypothetical protein